MTSRKSDEREGWSVEALGAAPMPHCRIRIHRPHSETAKAALAALSAHRRLFSLHDVAARAHVCRANQLHAVNRLRAPRFPAVIEDDEFASPPNSHPGWQRNGFDLSAPSDIVHQRGERVRVRPEGDIQLVAFARQRRQTIVETRARLSLQLNSLAPALGAADGAYI